LNFKPETRNFSDFFAYFCALKINRFENDIS
jgi:hypothetical protein